jgi:hypothetical protein
LHTCLGTPSEIEFHTKSKPNSNTEFNLLSTIQFFDNFLKGVSEIKRVSKDEVLEDWLQLEKECSNITLSIEEIKVLYHALLSNTPGVVREHRAVKRGIAHLVCHCSTIMTENGTLALLCRTDRDAQHGDVLVTVRGTSRPLLLRPAKEDGEYEYLGICFYQGFEYSERLFSDQVLKPVVLV